MSKINKQTKKEYLISDIIIGILLIGIIFIGGKIVFHYNNNIEEYLLQIIYTGSELDLLLNQYTITFLIISLLSLLSGKHEYIYWIDILEYKIILPSHRNFISLTIYSFLSMLAGTLAYFMCDRLLVLEFFIYDVTILIILTFKMVGVYFGKAKIQQKLYNEIIKDVKHYINTKEDKTFNVVSEKLNGIYEKAYQMAQDGKFDEIIKTDLQLFIDLTQFIPTEYDEKLVKLIYNNLQKIIMLFCNNPEILLNELFENKKATQYANTSQTDIILNSTMCAFFESVLSKHEYKVAYDSWIAKTYNMLVEAYQRVEDDLMQTLEISENFDYHSLIVYIWYNPAEKQCEPNIQKTLSKIDDKFNIMKSRLIYYSKLIYENSPFLFFNIISKNKLSTEIQRELELFKLVCRHGEIDNSRNVCRNICNQMHIFMISKYFAEYNDYKNIPDKIEGMGDVIQIQRFDKDKFYRINDKYLALLRYAAIEAKSPEIVEWLLGLLNDEIITIIYKITCEANKYPLLINNDNKEKLFNNVKISGFELPKILELIEREYYMYNGIILWIKKIKPLYEGNYNLSEYKMDMRINISKFDFYEPMK